jgi:MFS family permease
VLSVIVLLVFVRVRRETAVATPVGAPPPTDVPHEVSAAAPNVPTDDRSTPLGGIFWRYLVVVFVFTLGASSDAFLLIRAQQIGVPVVLIPILYAMLNLVKAVSSTPGGALSDRYGRRPLIIAGWALYAGVYLGFAFASAVWQAWALFAVYGLFFGLTEGAAKALVVDLVPVARRGTAFGWFNFAIGIAALPASLMFGVVWDQIGASAAFAMGALFAAVATAGLWIAVPTGAVPRAR